MKAKLLLLLLSAGILNLSDLRAQCATGTVHMNYYAVTSGSGTYADPGMGNIEYGFCLTLTSFFEKQTNWAHGVFVAWKDIPPGVHISQGLLGEQTTQHGSRSWRWIDSLRARQLGLPGIGYYVDDGDRNPTNNYGDNGFGTPNASFPGLSPFCFIAEYVCGAPTVFRPWVTVTGDGTTGAWKNPSCAGDVIKASTGGPLNDGILVVCGLLLPLDLISFEGFQKDGINYILWSGIADEKFSHYELEKRTGNSGGFILVQNFNVPNSVQENQQHKIQHQDAQTNNSICYYRLKMVEKDNSFVYSKTIAIVNSDKKKLERANIFPNPVEDELHIGFPDTKSTELYRIEFMGIDGKLIQSQNINIKGSGQLHLLNLDRFESGVYFLRVSKENEAGELYKVIKK